MYVQVKDFYAVLFIFWEEELIKCLQCASETAQIIFSSNSFKGNEPLLRRQRSKPTSCCTQLLVQQTSWYLSAEGMHFHCHAFSEEMDQRETGSVMWKVLECSVK